MRFLWITLIWTGMALWAVEPHWAYAPLRAPRVPEVGEVGEVGGKATHAVDAFIRAQWVRHGLQPAAEADRPTLLRRIYFDLIGLPPSPEDYQRFLADS